MSFDPFNLLGEVHSPEWFKTHELEVDKGDKIEIVPPSPSLPRPSPSYLQGIRDWGKGAYEGIAHLTGGEDDPKGIFAVSTTMDRIAQRLLQQTFDQTDKALKSVSLNDRIESIRKTYQKLKNLELNLKNHNAVIDEFNQRYVFKGAFIGCPTHEKILLRVDEQLKDLEKIMVALAHEKGTKTSTDVRAFSKLIDELKENLAHGLQMTKEVLLNSYPAILEKARQSGLDKQKTMVDSLNRLFNQSYLQYLIENIRHDQMPLPLSMELFAAKLEISPEEIRKKMAEGKNLLIERLQSFLADDHLTKPPPELAKKIQQDFLNTAAKLLSPQKAHLIKPFIEKLYAIETNLQRFIAKAEHETRDFLEKDFSELPFLTDEEERLKGLFLNKCQRHTFTPLLPKIMKELINPIDIKDLARFDEQVEAIKKKWSGKKISDFYAQEIQSQMEKYYQEAKQMAHIPTWQEKNAHAQRFAFNQSAWGEQQIFGEGVCAAINYRWIRRLLQNPSMKVKSASDLNPSRDEEMNFVRTLIQSEAFKKTGVPPESEVFDFSQIKAEDRVTQATYQLEQRLGATPAKPGSIGETILKRDQMSYERLETQHPTIKSLIESLVTNHLTELRSPDTVRPHRHRHVCVRS